MLFFFPLFIDTKPKKFFFFVRGKRQQQRERKQKHKETENHVFFVFFVSQFSKKLKKSFPDADACSFPAIFSHNLFLIFFKNLHTKVTKKQPPMFYFSRRRIFFFFFFIVRIENIFFDVKFFFL